jgi:hypothetical protein
MIKNIFFPQKINNKFFITQSFNVLEYDKNINCISGKNEKNKVVINQFYNENFLLDSVDQLQLASDLIGKKTAENIILIPDHLVLYRKLKIPLTDKATIKNIIKFEIGPTLPFDINSCVFDFFLILENDQKNCTVWITFVLKEALKNFLEPFENINLAVKSSLPVVLDLLKSLELKDHYIVCYQNGHVINILYLIDNYLNDIFLVSPESFDLTLTNLISSTNLANNVYLLNTLPEKGNFSFKKIELKDLKNVVVNVKNKNSLPLLLVAAAMRSTYSYEFNLVLKEKFKKESFYQIITFLSLFLAFLCLMIGNIFFNIYRFNDAERKITFAVKKELNKAGLDTKKTKLALIIKDIEKEIKTQESIWNALSKQKRFSYLVTLSEITKVINTNTKGLIIKKILFSPGTMTLEGVVKDYPSLQTLEEDINKSPYFKTISPLQETSFNVNIKILQDGVKV